MIILTDNPDVTVGTIDLFDYDPLHQRAEVGILVADEFRGKGYAQEAIELLVDYAFKTLLLHQLYCHVPTNREINIHLFNKCGFKVTGTRKEWCRDGDAWTDEYLMQLITNHS